jgi:hypothetical protein
MSFEGFTALKRKDHDALCPRPQPVFHPDVKRTFGTYTVIRRASPILDHILHRVI